MHRARSTAAVLAVLGLIAADAFAQAPPAAAPPTGPVLGAETPESDGSTSAPARAPGFDTDRLHAGHLLRRAGFGPTPAELDRALSTGFETWVEEQLAPEALPDVPGWRLGRIRRREPSTEDLVSRWHRRMIYTPRQLQERMTLVLHELFSVSGSKVETTFLLRHEDLLRRHALGSYRDLLVEVTTDPAMLLWLDNAFNVGTEVDEDGIPVPPNENYAREFLQLYVMGTVRLRMDGTPILDGEGRPVPTYSEADVREIARALTGWEPRYDWTWTPLDRPARFHPWAHDAGDKTILGRVLPGRSGADGAREVEAVVDLVMAEPSVAPFVSKQLIQKLATETPTPAYVERVASVFAASGGDLRETVRAILLDPEFRSEAVVRTQIREPVDQFVGLARALDASTRGHHAGWSGWHAGQPLHHPPSVFSYYRPGMKAALLNTAYVLARDQASSEMLSPWFDRHDMDVRIPWWKLRFQQGVTTPEAAVAWFEDWMLVAPMEASTRALVLEYLDGSTATTRLRGAAWLVATSPDYQRF